MSRSMTAAELKIKKGRHLVDAGPFWCLDNQALEPFWEPDKSPTSNGFQLIAARCLLITSR